MTRVKSSLVLLVALGLIAGSVATAQAGQRPVRAQRTVKANYYGAQVLYGYRSCSLSGGAGCVTIDTRAGEESLTARASDAHGQPVSVWVVNARTGTVYGTFCGRTTKPVRFDPGTKLELWIGGEWWPTWWIVPEVDCVPGVATTGTVSVTLSNLP